MQLRLEAEVAPIADALPSRRNQAAPSDSNPSIARHRDGAEPTLQESSSAEDARGGGNALTHSQTGNGRSSRNPPAAPSASLTPASIMGKGNNGALNAMGLLGNPAAGGELTFSERFGIARNKK